MIKRLILIIGIVVIIFGVYQVKFLNKAHSSFDNYYSFRGCTQLVIRTSTYGVCKLASGKNIKIVLYHDKWYLDGDLPTGFLGHLL